MTTRRTATEAETEALGRLIGASLVAGDVVLLSGPLGAGKTAFVRGLVEGLDGDPAQVSSPTFTLVQDYVARVPLKHADLHRLSPVEVDDLGLDEAGEGSVLAVEWPDRWRDPPPTAVRVEIVPDAEGREIRVEGAWGHSTR